MEVSARKSQASGRVSFILTVLPWSIHHARGCARRERDRVSEHEQRGCSKSQVVTTQDMLKSTGTRMSLQGAFLLCVSAKVGNTQEEAGGRRQQQQQQGGGRQQQAAGGGSSHPQQWQQQERRDSQS